MSRRNNPYTGRKRLLSLTRLASTLFVILLSPAITTASEIITNTADLTNTFGSATDDNQYVNRGSITVNRNGAIGMLGGDGSVLTNRSVIAVTGPNATGMQGGDAAILENILGGTITVNEANGIAMSTSGSGGVIDNSAAIILNGNANAGLFASETVSNGRHFTVYNMGTITGNGSDSQGIRVLGDSARLINYPNADIHLTGTNSTGMSLTGNNGTLYNGGSLATEAVSGTGIAATGNGNAITNTGKAIIHLAGDNSTGIAITGNNATIRNAASIIAEGSDSNGISTSGANATIGNSGTISATGTGSNGIYVNSTDTTVANKGTITAISGHQLAIGSAGGATVREWKLAIAPARWQDHPQWRPFGVAPGGSFHLDDTVMTFRPGSTDDDFRFDTTYPVANLIDNNGTVTGAIGSVQKSVLPMVDVYVHSTAAPGTPVSWDNQYFSLSVDPDKSHGHQSNVNTIRSTQRRLWLANLILGATLDNASDWHAFIQPYYLDAHASGTSGSDSNSTGLILGGTRTILPNWRIGAHLGIEHTNLSARNFGLNGDSTSWLAGLHTRLDLPQNTFIRGQLTGMASRSHYDFSMVGDTASDERNETGVFANLTGGIDIKLTRHHQITPELGLAYLWLKNPSMNVNWRNPDNADLSMRFDSTRYHATFATASLRYTGNWTVAQGQFSPMFSAGLRQTISSADIDSEMSFMGKRYRGSSHEDKTVKTIEAGLKYTRGRTSAALRYNGNFGNTISDHIVWAEFGFVF